MRGKGRKVLAMILAWLMVFSMIPSQTLAAADFAAVVQTVESAQEVNGPVQNLVQESESSGAAVEAGSSEAESTVEAGSSEAESTVEAGSSEAESTVEAGSAGQEAGAASGEGTEAQKSSESVSKDGIGAASIWNVDGIDSLAQNAGTSNADGTNTEASESAGTVVSMPAFTPAAVKLDGVVITVSAPEGVFPEGALLSVKKVEAVDQEKVDEAVEAERSANVNVAASYTFDISVLDEAGNELQPTDGSKVKVSFALAEVADNNLDTAVYHVSERP